MIENKFSLGEEVFYFDVEEEKIESGAVRYIWLDENGVINYGIALKRAICENAAFRSHEECASYYASLFATL